MSSREQILAAVAKSQPTLVPLPLLPAFSLGVPDLAEKFTSVAVTIGSRVFWVKDYGEVQEVLSQEFDLSLRTISQIPALSGMGHHQASLADEERHQLENVNLAILEAHFGVAENGAVWVTEDLMGARVLPFICQHLAVVISKKQILPLMHDAYERIGDGEYGYGVFIAGPSKTADIEQSLVLGAHGPRTMTVFLLNEGNYTF